MQKFKIVSDSSCDLPKEFLEKHDIKDVRFYVTFDGTNFLKESVDITIDEYFHRLSTEENFPKTSQPSPQDYIDVFTPILDEGLDILCFCLSSHLSGSYQSAVNAAAILKDDYPNLNIRIIDSEQAFISTSLMILRAIEHQNAGKELDLVADYIERLKKETRIIIALETLENLKRGGRIGTATAMVGSLLNLKPILTLNSGIIGPLTKVRGRKKSLSTLVEIMEKDTNLDLEKYDFMVGHAMCEEDGKSLKNSVETALGTKLTTPLLNTGPTIGTHIGIGAVAIAYAKKMDL